MSKTIYDIFISYRRDGGGATAGRINDMLMADGYSVSYDVDTLREGRFDKQLLERIEQCQDFILVVDKNCFVRTIDPITDPLDDWLWQELSYALQLRKNVIPILLAGASFPKRLPADIDAVRLINGPKCVHEYFDSFYSKLKECLHSYPRMEKASYTGAITSESKMPCLKLKADIDCIFYLDGEEHSHLKAGVIKKIPLAKGEYELMFVSEENEKDCLVFEFEMPDVDKLQKVNLKGISKVHTQKGVETLRIAEEKCQTEAKRSNEEFESRHIIEERKLEAEQKDKDVRNCRGEEKLEKEKMFNVGGVTFKMILVEGYGSPFYIGETLVTQELWEILMKKNPSKFKGKNHPVECVSWHDCQVFIKLLNLSTKNNFRLPKESEWKYVSKGGNRSHGYVYAGSNNIDYVAWYDKNAYFCGSKNPDYGTHDVKTKQPNELGVYDMSGNVWEWCEDMYESNDARRVIMGGSWYDNASSCRVDSRSIIFPDKGFNLIGFRLLLVCQ